MCLGSLPVGENCIKNSNPFRRYRGCTPHRLHYINQAAVRGLKRPSRLSKNYFNKKIPNDAILVLESHRLAYFAGKRNSIRRLSIFNVKLLNLHGDPIFEQVLGNCVTRMYALFLVRYPQRQ